MGKINRNDVQNYKVSGNYFSLKDDGDSAYVRFLFGSAGDMDNHIHTIHRVKSGSGKDTREVEVDCLRADHNAPHEDCPMCAAKLPVQVKIFVPLYDEDEKKVKIWERGRALIQELEKQFKYLPKDADICSTPFIIERSGKAGDKGTKYVLIQQAKDADKKTLEDFDPIPEVSEGFLHCLSFEECETLLDTGELPQKPVETRGGGSRDEGRKADARGAGREERGRRDVPADSGRDSGVRSRRR